jgi:hypothetical protein
VRLDGDWTTILANGRPGVTLDGRFSEGTVYLTEDGRNAAFDGNEELTIIAVIVNGVCYPV